MNGRTAAPDPAASAVAAPPAGRRWSDLAPRALSAVVMVILALGSAVLGGVVFVLFWTAAGLAILWEWQHLVGHARAGLRFGVGAVVLVAVAWLSSGGLPLLALPILLAGMVVLAVVAPAALRVVSGAGLLYAGAFTIAIVLLRRSVPEGLDVVLWLFAVVWGTDIMAYFGGRLVGGPKLWRRLSPGKTWAGFLIGIAAGSLCGLAAAPVGTTKPVLVLVGLAAGALAQGGDLFESGFKRHYGVKDSGRLIPGHGGAMDRLDGFVVACLFAAVLGAARMGVDAAGSGVLKW